MKEKSDENVNTSNQSRNMKLSMNEIWLILCIDAMEIKKHVHELKISFNHSNGCDIKYCLSYLSSIMKSSHVKSIFVNNIFLEHFVYSSAIFLNNLLLLQSVILNSLSFVSSKHTDFICLYKTRVLKELYFTS